MAAVKSFSRGAAEGQIRHCERLPEEHRNRKNKDIHSELTARNYKLSPPELTGSLMQRVNRICESEGIKLPKRKDLNVMCSWVITLPENIKSIDERQQFFSACYDFLCKRYGAGHVLMATVHLDETTPHMHFGWLPVAKKENGDLTVSSKRVLTLRELKSFHGDLFNHLKQTTGREWGVVNGKTAAAGGNQTVDEMKAAALQKAEAAYKQIVESKTDIESKPQKLHKDMVSVRASDLETLVQAVRMAEVMTTQASQAMQEVGQREQAVKAREQAIKSSDVTQLENQVAKLERQNTILKQELAHYRSVEAEVNVEF